MNLVKKAAIGVAAVAALVAIIGAVLPRTAHVERSAVIEAPPAMVFTVLNGFRQFNQWSPWAGIDPNAKTTFEGPAAGVGAKMSWAGNRDVGSGSQEIVEAQPYERVKLRLAFGDFGGDFSATFALSPQDKGTHVTWSFDGDYGGNPLSHWFALLSDRMIGKDYEKGLARLKAMIEAMPKGDFSSLEIESVETQDDPIVFLSIHTADEPRAIGLGVGVAYSRLSGYLATKKVKQTGAPLAIFRGRDGNTLRIDAAVPVNDLGAALASGVQHGRLPGGRALKAVFRGSYMDLPIARQQVLAYLSTAGFERAGPNWERYISDVMTELYYPIK